MEGAPTAPATRVAGDGGSRPDLAAAMTPVMDGASSDQPARGVDSLHPRAAGELPQGGKVRRVPDPTARSETVEHPEALEGHAGDGEGRGGSGEGQPIRYG